MYHLAKSLYLHATSKEGEYSTTMTSHTTLERKSLTMMTCQNTRSSSSALTMPAKLLCSSK
jgi:hypothetical protein